MVSGPTDRPIRSIQTDSRRVKPGDLFVAYRGVSVDLHNFITQAVANGASAVVLERDIDLADGVTEILVPNARRTWAEMCSAWQDHPSHKLIVVGVTGTDGKTTTSSMLASILQAAGKRVGLVTTVAAEIAGQPIDTGFHTTTPEPPEIQAYLAEMVEKGTEVAIVETTSHALAHEKVAGIAYDVAVVTNVTHEHLDFHGTWEAYLEAKAKLFDGLASSYRKPGVPKVAIVNADDASFARLSQAEADRRITYSLDRADVTPRQPVSVRLSVPGAFNVANALAATAAALALDTPHRAIQQGLASFRGVPGRLEVIDQRQPFQVIVDFAHTPNSLRRVLELARTLTKGKVSVVFGCAGERDVAKRPLMGQAAADLADRVYLTAEDPRREDLAMILDQIAATVPAAERVPDRGEAIATALRDASPGDLVLITGKGHEQSMCFGETETPWDDREAARSALRALGYS